MQVTTNNTSTNKEDTLPGDIAITLSSTILSFILVPLTLITVVFLVWLCIERLEIQNYCARHQEKATGNKAKVSTVNNENNTNIIMPTVEKGPLQSYTESMVYNTMYRETKLNSCSTVEDSHVYEPVQMPAIVE